MFSLQYTHKARDIASQGRKKVLTFSEIRCRKLDLFSIELIPETDRTTIGLKVSFS